MINLSNDTRALVLFRKAGSSGHRLMAENSGTGEKTFLFHPFNAQKEPPIKIHADQDIRCQAADIPDIEGIVTSCMNIKYGQPFQDERSYCAMIGRAIEKIRTGELNKIVLSRVKETRAVHPARIIDLYLRLVEDHPQAFVYLFIHPKSGIWVGATPEVLLNEKDGCFHTMSLAGTRHAESSGDWGEKEKEEQAIVTRFIEEGLRSLGAGSLEMDGPKNKIAGKLVHLMTEIRFDYKGEVGDVLELLHPTPAVAGVPRSEALKAISTLEGSDRSYYTGYCGFKEKDEASYFVNLRCAQLLKEHTLVYVGGGITADSNPADEWKETELKSTTIINAIEKI